MTNAASSPSQPSLDLVRRINARIHDAPMPTEQLLDEAAERIQELEAQLILAQPLYSRRQIEEQNASLKADNEQLRRALEPFAAEKLPSARRSEIAYDRHGLRRCISPLELARDRAFAALSPSTPEVTG